MPFLKGWAQDASVWDVFRADPIVYEPFLEHVEALMRGPSSLSAAEKELIGAFVSGVNECDYCYGGHAAVATIFGVDSGLFSEVLTDIDSSSADEKFKPILKFVRKLTRDHQSMEQSDVDAIFDAGWDEKAFRDAVAICGMFNLMNRMVHGFGIKDFPDRHAAMARGNVKYGYIQRFRDALESEGYPGTEESASAQVVRS